MQDSKREPVAVVPECRELLAVSKSLLENYRNLLKEAGGSDGLLDKTIEKIGEYLNSTV